MLVKANVLNLLGRHCVLRIFLHNTVPDASWHVRGGPVTFLGLPAFIIIVQQLLIVLILLFLCVIWFVLCVDLAIIKGVPVDVLEERVIFDFISVAD